MSIADMLLARQGLISLDPGGGASRPALLQALDVELAALGYALSERLRRRLATLAPDDLARTWQWMRRVLEEQSGAAQQHVPLFRSFPHDVPDDTFELWVRKVLVFFIQAPDQPCLFCRRTGTTHVLSPCLHVVCDRCFDGASYSACPACERHVDRGSPFFKPAGVRLPSADERVTFKLLDLGDGDAVEARRLFLALCARKQALSPADRDALATIVEAGGEDVLGWLPEEIPVKETVAAIFGALLESAGNPEAILGRARAYLTTATDVLRLLAALSGADAALQGEVIYREAVREVRGRPVTVRLSRTVNRFRMARLSRPLRRGLLALLDGLGEERLLEDMLRHRSYWIWAGEFLHPFEYAARFPRAALAFAVLRGTRPRDDALGTALRESERALERARDGSYVYRSYYARLERAAAEGDSAEFTRLLSERPGELARRLDHALRLALAAGTPLETVVNAYIARTGSLATPVLLTLASLLPTRASRAPMRLFWPKGQIARGVLAPDERPTLPPSAIAPLVGATQGELLRRFATKPVFADAVVDEALATIVVPFNERTASRAAVALPRGSRLDIPEGRVLRLFLHWCQPPAGSRDTDLDLSVAFYDEAWRYSGVCSYYQLKYSGRTEQEIALSAGDLRDAPYPDGATELVDLHRERAQAEGIRYAVMVVNSYAGLPFSALERAYAGVMARDDADGLHVDPRTVTLKFALQGESGTFLPMVVDIQEGVLHWLDVYARGEYAFNNVETSRRAIQSICPAMMASFAGGARPSMRDLALLHAAARCATVYVRGAAGPRRFARRPGEEPDAFHRRIGAGEADEELRALPALARPVLACLLHGDLDLPAGSTCYALFRERQTATTAASDLLA